MTTVVTICDDQDVAGEALDALRKAGFDGSILKPEAPVPRASAVS